MSLAVQFQNQQSFPRIEDLTFNLTLTHIWPSLPSVVMQCVSLTAVHLFSYPVRSQPPTPGSHTREEICSVSQQMAANEQAA